MSNITFWFWWWSSKQLFLCILCASLYCTVHITNNKPPLVSTADADGQQIFFGWLIFLTTRFFFVFFFVFLTNDGFKKWWGQKRAFKRSGEDLQRLHQSSLQTSVCFLSALSVNGSHPGVITWGRNSTRNMWSHMKKGDLNLNLGSRFWMALDVKEFRDFLSCHWSTRHSYQRPFFKSDRVVI